MVSRLLSSFRIPAIALSAILQMMPMVRQALPALQTSGSLMAIIFRWGVGAAAALGGVQAVSGASTVITTGDITATNGVPTSTRLLTSPQSAGWWSASGLPPGVNLTQNGSRWYLAGTPTTVGVYSVNLVAKSSASAGPSETTSKTISFTVLEGSGGNNSPPTASPQTVSTAEDSAKAITLSGNDSDGDPLTYTVVNPPTHGSLTGTAPNLLYTPAADYNGADSFTFRVNDGSLNSTDATVSITISPVNDAPTAVPQTVTTAEDTAKGITLSGSDVEGSALTYVIVTPPVQGTLSGTVPNVTYLPAANYNGTDSFTFRVNDGSLNSADATVAITVSPVNDAPTADPQTVTTAEDTAKGITLSGSDVEGSALTYAIVTPPTHGTLSGTVPNVTYFPAANYNGNDSFTFRVSDGSLNSSAATVDIAVSTVNDAPTANAQSVSTPENTPRSITLTGFDVEGSPLSYSVVANPTHGTITGTAPNLTYTPNAAYSGTDAFSFKVNDGSLDSATATVSVIVSSVNTPPTANAQIVSATEDTVEAITLSGTDPNGDPLSYTVLAQPTKGLLSGTAPDLTYTPDSNVNGPDSFTFRVNDGAADSAPATVSIDIAAVNDVPVANAQTVTTAEDTARAVNLTGSDIEGSSLSYLIVSPPTHGVLTGTPPNVTYAPAANFNGSDSFSFRVNDGALESPTAPVSISVTPVNDPPVAANLNSGASSGSTVTLNPLASCSDPDGDALSLVAVSPTNGTATISGGTSILFTAPSNFVGTAYVGYTLTDGHGGTAWGLFTLTVTTGPATQLSVQAGSVTINSQTGLYDQQVTIRNVGTGTAAAVRLKVGGLRSGVTLYNAAGEEGGVPYVQQNTPLNPGDSVGFHLEFYVSDRQAFTDSPSAEAVLPESLEATPGNAVAVDRTFMDRTNPGEPRFTIEFATVPDRIYTIIYTDDMVNWKVATPSLTATATRTQWHDDGPPKTDSLPVGGRFYRVIAQ